MAAIEAGIIKLVCIIEEQKAKERTKTSKGRGKKGTPKSEYLKKQSGEAAVKVANEVGVGKNMIYDARV